MKTIIEILTENVSKAFATCGYSAEFGSVKESDRPDLFNFNVTELLPPQSFTKNLPP